MASGGSVTGGGMAEAGAASAVVGGRRSLLFLQGPISLFFDRLGRALASRGHRVHRINLHWGDRLLWRLPAADYRGSLSEWRGYIGAALERHQVTDLVVHGDRRPYHLIAAEEARARGIAVLATDLGYVRPDWLTLERDGMTSYSRFPRDPAAIRALAADFPEPELAPRFATPFWLIAGFDILYNLGLVLGRPFYPFYRYHSIVHPFVEYAGWLGSRPKQLLGARATARAKARLAACPGSYFLVPLQISTDFQIRAHSPYGDVREAARAIIASYARSGSARTLVFVVHPLDNGLIFWHRLIARQARRHGVAGRVVVLDGGTPIELMRQAAGIVTINSTVGVTALRNGVPVKTLGRAIYDIAGLTDQQPLAGFWQQPRPPDLALLDDFLRALVGATQVKGGYYTRAAQDHAIAGFVARLEGGLYPLPPLDAAALAACPPRPATRSVVIDGGLAAQVATALARAWAMPGVRVCLSGPAGADGDTTDGPGFDRPGFDRPGFDRLAADCRRRGAVVERLGAASLAAGVAAAGAGPRDIVVAAAERPDARAAGRPVDALVDALIDARADARAAALGRRGPGSAADPAASPDAPVTIVLVSRLAGRPAGGDPEAAGQACAALRAAVRAGRRRWRAAGVAVALVVPSRLAGSAAAWLGQPQLAALAADRLAERVRRGVARQRAVIAVPGATTLAWQIVRQLQRRLGERARSVLTPDRAGLGPPADKTPLPGQAGPAD